MKHIKKLIALALMAITVLAITLPALAATHVGRGIVRTGGSSLPIYQFANTIAPIKGSLANNGIYLFRYNSPSDAWLQREVDGTPGFVLASKVKLYANMSGPGTQTQAYGSDSGSDDIELHDRGNRVRNVQLVLKAEGLSGGSVDGAFGANTLKGVKQYQQKHNLRVDGIVGAATKRSMWSGHELLLRENGFK